MNTIILDIETVPDLNGLDQAGWAGDQSAFPPWPLHEVACVSMLSVQTDLLTGVSFALQSFSGEDLTERSIIAETERLLVTAQTVVTFNGRGFDIPVMMARAGVHKVSVPALASLHAQRRYSAGQHIDLLEEVTHYGAAPRIRLAELCAAFSIPAKLGTDGGQVANLIAKGEWKRVIDYCEQDIVCTYLAWLRWRAIERDAFEIEEQDNRRLIDWIKANPSELEHLIAFTAQAPRPPCNAPALEYPILGW